MTYEELREQISKEMGWWSPDEFDAYPEKTDKVLQLFATLGAEVIGEDEPESANGLLPDRVDRRNQLRSEQTARLAQLTTKNPGEGNV